MVAFGINQAKCVVAMSHNIVERTKKADVANRPQAFHHDGLLIVKPVGQANLFFNMSSDIYHNPTAF